MLLMKNCMKQMNRPQEAEGLVPQRTRVVKELQGTHKSSAMNRQNHRKFCFLDTNYETVPAAILFLILRVDKLDHFYLLLFDDGDINHHYHHHQTKMRSLINKGHS